MDEVFIKLLQEIDDLMIAMNNMPSFKESTPEATVLKQKVAKLARIRSKYRAKLTAIKEFNAPAPMGSTVQKVKIDPEKFWNSFDKAMSNDYPRPKQ